MCAQAATGQASTLYLQCLCQSGSVRQSIKGNPPQTEHPCMSQIDCIPLDTCTLMTACPCTQAQSHSFHVRLSNNLFMHNCSHPCSSKQRGAALCEYESVGTWCQSHPQVPAGRQGRMSVQTAQALS